MPTNKIRDVEVWSPELDWEERKDGTFRIWRKDPLENYPNHMSERLFHWAKVAPRRTWMAERAADGTWVKVTYQQLANQLESVAQGLIDLNLSKDRPVMILSGNSLKHAILALAAQHIGIPSAAISTAYSLALDNFDKLNTVVEQISPGLVFVDNINRFENAIKAAFSDNVTIVSGNDITNIPSSIGWSELISTTATESVSTEHAKTGPDTIAKFLFTSGTTGSPKAVIQTQRMLCSNQQQILDCFPFMKSEPPVFVDWAPWNHTASGNKIFNMTIYNGGTYYIDGGKPTPNGFSETVRNLKEISPTWYFNVPVGYELLLEAMETDSELRASFFKNLNMLMYAGAGLAGRIWERLKSISVETTGEEILLTTGLGSTETAPFSLYCCDPQDGPGNVGIPAQGVEMKLVPSAGKLEVRFKGPNITPGYWRDEITTAAVFDEEGYYRMGDALRFSVPGDPTKGFYFDGRIAENFKLATGTWVAVADVRTQLSDALSGLALDVVIAGEGRNELAALIIPFHPAIERIVGRSDLSDEELFNHPSLQENVAKHLNQYAAKIKGSSRRVERVIFLETPLKLNTGELTEKGSVNQRAVLRNHANLVDTLYSSDPKVIIVSAAGTN